MRSATFADRGSVARVLVSIRRLGGRAAASRCRFVTASGRLNRPRSCRRPVRLRARGKRSWKVVFSKAPPRGRYRATAQAVDAKGNLERAGARNTIDFTLGR